MQPRGTASISTLLADDEQLALDELQYLLKDFPEIDRPTLHSRLRTGLRAVLVVRTRARIRDPASTAAARGIGQEFSFEEARMRPIRASRTLRTDTKPMSGGGTLWESLTARHQGQHRR